MSWVSTLTSAKSLKPPCELAQHAIPTLASHLSPDCTFLKLLGLSLLCTLPLHP